MTLTTIYRILKGPMTDETPQTPPNLTPNESESPPHSQPSIPSQQGQGAVAGAVKQVTQANFQQRHLKSAPPSSSTQQKLAEEPSLVNLALAVVELFRDIANLKNANSQAYMYLNNIMGAHQHLVETLISQGVLPKQTENGDGKQT